MIDEAHGIGVFGPRGAGYAASLGMTDKIDLIMGTFSKSLASIGGFIAGDENVIHYLKHNSRSFIFSASMAPGAVAAALAATDIMMNEPERMIKLWDNTKYMHKCLIQAGFKTSNGETPILPVFVGDDFLAFKICTEMQEHGVFVNAAVSPAVQPGNALIRLSLMSSHSFEDIDYAVDKLLYSSKKFGQS